MPPRSVLLLRSILPPMLLTATPYYEDRSLARLVNVPYELAHICPEPPAASEPARENAQTPPSPPIDPAFVDLP